MKKKYNMGGLPDFHPLKFKHSESNVHDLSESPDLKNTHFGFNNEELERTHQPLQLHATGHFGNGLTQFFNQQQLENSQAELIQLKP